MKTVQPIERDTRPWTPGQEELPGGILGFVDRVFCAVAAAGLSLVSVILIWQVAARYIFGHPTVWSEELAVGIFVWTAMIAIALGVRRGEHLTLDVLSKRLPAGVNKALGIVLCLLSVATFLVLAWYCVRLLGPADRQSLAGIQLGLGLPAKVSWIYLAVPVGFGLAAVFSVERLVLLLRGRIAVLNVDADSAAVAAIELEVAHDSARPAAHQEEGRS